MTYSIRVDGAWREINEVWHYGTDGLPIAIESTTYAYKIFLAWGSNIVGAFTNNDPPIPLDIGDYKYDPVKDIVSIRHGDGEATRRLEFIEDRAVGEVDRQYLGASLGWVDSAYVYDERNIQRVHETSFGLTVTQITATDSHGNPRTTSTTTNRTNAGSTTRSDQWTVTYRVPAPNTSAAATNELKSIALDPPENDGLPVEEDFETQWAQYDDFLVEVDFDTLWAQDTFFVERFIDMNNDGRLDRIDCGLSRATVGCDITTFYGEKMPFPYLCDHIGVLPSSTNGALDIVCSRRYLMQWNGTVYEARE